MGYFELIQYFHPLKLASLLSWLHEQMEKGPWKTKDLPDQAKDIQYNTCSHAIHSQLPLLTSHASYQPTVFFGL